MKLYGTELEHSQALRVLHNPRYAGAFAFGQTRTRQLPDGEIRYQHLPQEQWQVLIPEHHPGYISWAQYQSNQQRLRDNAAAYSVEHRGPPREGNALLQGLVLCGRCGRRMTLRYHTQQGRSVPQYMCQAEGVKAAKSICQSIPGGAIDTAVAQKLLDVVQPVTLEVTLAVEQELQAQAEQSDRLRHQQIQRARYESELARRRYLRCDPDNRLVADTLEAEWNEKLRILRQAQEDYERQAHQISEVLNDEQRQRILALAQNLPRLWHDPATPQRERKRLLRLLIEDVTLIKGRQISVAIRYKAGRTEILTLPPPKM